jgi:hypothetical protein
LDSNFENVLLNFGLLSETFLDIRALIKGGNMKLDIKILALIITTAYTLAKEGKKA